MNKQVDDIKFYPEYGDEGIDCNNNKWERDLRKNHSKNLSGESFNKLLVLFKVYENREITHNAKWLCKCECGNLIIVSTRKLNSNTIQSCGCFYDDSIRKRNKNVKSLVGQRFGALVILDRDYEYASLHPNLKDKIFWKCKCDCGKITAVSTTHLTRSKQPTRSCGCYIGQELPHAFKDLTGQRFGKLIALERDFNYITKNGTTNGTYWKCQCDCGKIITTTTNALKEGRTKSCGCIRGEHLIIDLKNQKFGKLTVIKFLKTEKNNAIWLCKCNCGSTLEVSGASLRSGNTKSCGCLKSSGEYVISNLLSENNVVFERQKSYEECRFPETNHKAYFDFYINNSFLLEFDGEQHFIAKNSGWNNIENHNKILIRDEYKNNWCLKNKIPLKRIPYYDLEKLTIEDIMSDKYLIKGDS